MARGCHTIGGKNNADHIHTYNHGGPASVCIRHAQNRNQTKRKGQIAMTSIDLHNIEPETRRKIETYNEWRVENGKPKTYDPALVQPLVTKDQYDQWRWAQVLHDGQGDIFKRQRKKVKVDGVAIYIWPVSAEAEKELKKSYKPMRKRQADKRVMNRLYEQWQAGEEHQYCESPLR